MSSTQRLSLLILFTATASAWPAPVDYAKQIDPLLQDRCADCHAGADADGDFALDTFAALMKGGKNGKAIRAKEADESLLVKFLEGRSGKTGKNQFMPPGKKEHLKPEEIDLIKQWINEGAQNSSASAAVTAPLAKLPKIPTKTEVKPIYAIATSAAGKVLALARFGSVELRDAATNKRTGIVATIAGKPNALVFSADGTMLFAAAGDAGVSGIAYQIKVADASVVRTFTGHSDALYALALSPDGKTLATGGYDQKIRLWDMASGKETAMLKGHNGSVNSLSFRPDGKVLASASGDRTIKLWDVATAKRLDTFSQPLKEQFAVAFAPDGKTLLAGGADNRIRAWTVSADAREGSNPILLSKFAHEGAVTRLSFSPDGKSLVSLAADKTIKIWNATDVSELHLLEKQPDLASSVAWLSATGIAVARMDGTIARYDSGSGKRVALASVTIAVAPAAKGKIKAAKAAMTAPVVKLWPAGFQIGGTTEVDAIGAVVTAAACSDARVKLTIKGNKLTVVADKTLPRGAVDVTLTTAAGPVKAKLQGDDLQQKQASEAVVTAPTDLWSTLTAVGQQDRHTFHADAGQTIVLDIMAKALASKAQTLMLEVLDAAGKTLAANRGLDSDSDPFIAFTAPVSGTYTARVHELTLDGSADHVYRLTLGALPYITGVHPLSVAANAESKATLIGANLTERSVIVKAGAAGTAKLEVSPAYRSRIPLTVQISDMVQASEVESNDTAQTAQAVKAPAAVHGSFLSSDKTASSDADYYSFTAKAGEEWIIETLADMAGSPADTRVDVLTPTGDPITRVQLQALRDSAVTFRSVDANNPDIRLVNWEEMDLNEFVYFQGDVAKIFRAPRGPDSGSLHYSIGGKRCSYFDTTATNHPLDEPAYVVAPVAPGAVLVPNGLPVFDIPFANDDAGDRTIGHDSRLLFTAPKDGMYVVRVTESTGSQGERFVYRMSIRKPMPAFEVKLTGNDQTIGAGGSMGFALRATRRDYFEGPITVKIEGMPQGYFASSPLTIQEGHVLASGSISAAPDAPATTDWSKVKLTATAMVNGKPVTTMVNNFGSVKLGPQPKFIAHLEPDRQGKPVARSGMTPLVITMVPGQITKAWLRVERHGDNGIINFDLHSLPHGVIVNDIGLSGVQVRAGEVEREIELIGAKWVQPQERLIHACVSSARNEADSSGLTASFPVLLRVVKNVVAAK